MAQATDYFKRTIEVYLQQRATEDELFAATFANPAKNIDDCITYILNAVKASGYHGFADEEIYSMALHYYDEPNIEVGKPVSCNVVVNHHIELTEQEKQQAREQAMQRATNEAYAKLKQPAKKSSTAAVDNQPSLF